MTNNELMIDITTHLAQIDGADEIEQEQLVKCIGMVAAFMMLELGISLIETDELELAVNAK